MLSLMKGVFEPSIPYTEKIFFMTSIGLNHTMGSGGKTNALVADNIKNLLTSPNSRLPGLLALEIALQQNNDLYKAGKWNSFLFDILKDSTGAVFIKEACLKVLCITIPFIAKESSTNSEDFVLFIQNVFPFLLEKIDESVEWSESACRCIKISLQIFPQALAPYKDQILCIILEEVSYSVSSRSFEVLADCFCELPKCSKEKDKLSYQERWKKQYLSTLRTLQNILNNCLKSASRDEPYERPRRIKALGYVFKENDDDRNLFPAFMKQVRRFTNLCKCLAKMLSTKTQCSVPVPSMLTLSCLLPLFTACNKEKLVSVDEELLYSCSAQMQIAALSVVESLILNCELLKCTIMVKEFITLAVRSSTTVISSEPVSQIRISAWKVLETWLGTFGAKVSKEIAESSELIEELLNDIAIDVQASSQIDNTVQTQQNVDNISINANYDSSLKIKNRQLVCGSALNALESLLYTGSTFIGKEMTQEIFSRIFKISNSISVSYDFPLPYNEESCRSSLYSLLLSTIIVSKPDEVHETAMRIFAAIDKDPSFKVKNVCKKAVAICRLQLHPKKPIPVYSDDKRRKSKKDDQMTKYPEWSSCEYEENLHIETVSESPEKVNTNVEEQFHNSNDDEIESKDFMEVEAIDQYPEIDAKDKLNMEEIEIQSSSQCQDDIESEEEEEEEEEDEEISRSYGEEEMPQEEVQHEMYIPTPRKIQILNPVQINSETMHHITETEYEELRPCVKVDDKIDNSNKDIHLNGDDSVVPDEQTPSSSQPNIANENGICGGEDELEDENNDEDEEEGVPFPSEKRVECFDPPPLKRQKIEANEENEICEREENSRSPTLAEMKADFCCTEVEDVKS